MASQALTFTLTSPGGRLLGMALVSVEAQYVSVLWAGADRIDRAFASPAIWSEIAHQVSSGLSPQPLDRQSAIAQLFAAPGHRAITVRWLHAVPVTVDPPELVADVLDAKLRNSAQHWALSVV